MRIDKNSKTGKTIQKRMGEVIKKGDVWYNYKYTQSRFYTYQDMEVIVSNDHISLYNKTRTVNPFIERFYGGVIMGYDSKTISVGRGLA